MVFFAVAALLIAVGFCAAGLVIVIHLAFAQRNRVPYVSTPAKMLPELVKTLELPATGTFVDLGCGNGCVLQAVGRAAPKLRLVGVENNPVPLVAARAKLGADAKLVLGSILETDLRAADRVFAYLGPDLLNLLEKKFDKELPAGARVVALQYPLPHRRPVQEIVPKNGKPFASRLYIYDY